MTTVNTGSRRRVLLALVLTAALLCGLLTAVGLGYPILAGEHTVTVAAVVVGALAQLACGAVGMAIGLICCRQTVPRAGYAVLLAVVLVGIVVVVPALPPVGPVLKLLSGEDSPAVMMMPLVGWTALAIALLLGSFVAVGAVGRRRD
jgi:hypothetical protein